MSTTPRHRFRFSLRTLFVLVTVVCIWLGWQLKTSRDRKATLEWVERLGGYSNVYRFDEFNRPKCAAIEFDRKKASKISRLQMWLGDPPIRYINLVTTKATWEEREQIALLFPEAFVMPEYPSQFAPRD